jgi:TolA-binding protein
MKLVEPARVVVLLLACAATACVDPPVEAPPPFVAAPQLPPIEAPRCAEGSTWNGSECEPTAPPLQVAAPEPAPNPPPPAAPASTARAVSPFDALRDGRQWRLTPRANRAVLIVEIQSLESLFANTSKTAPDRPTLIRRLAEAYVELEASATQALLAGLSGAAAQKEEAIRVSARQNALKYYSLSRTKYPTWCPSPATAYPATRAGNCADEVLYFLGYEHERSGDHDSARRRYLELIQSFPQSRYISATYLAFGELFFDEAASDPSKLPLAEQAYREVIKYPPPANEVFGYAHYKLGLVRARSGDVVGASAAFKKAVAWSTANPQAPAAAEVAAEATKAGGVLSKTRVP